MNETLQKIWDHPKRDVVVAGIASFAVGFAVGRLLPRKVKKEVYTVKGEVYKPSVGDEIVEIRQHAPKPAPLVISEDQHEAMKRNEFVFNVNDDSSDRIDYTRPAAQEIEDIRPDKKYEEIVIEREVVEEPEPELERVNVFARTTPEWNYEEELKKRTPEKPYIIHQDEFFEEGDFDHFAQISCTYYAGDDILANNSDNKALFNHVNLVGDLATMPFGYGTEEPETLYVRNEKRQAEYEIILHPGKFAVEVENLEEDILEDRTLRHSRVPRFPKE